MTSARSQCRGKVTAAGLLATASLAALLTGMPRAAAQDCTGLAAPPADLATPSMLFDTLRTHTNAEMLAINFLRKPVKRSCAWIYEVKVLTASGSVVELDFDAEELDLVGARGPENDRDAAALVKKFGGESSILITGAAKDDPGAKGSGKESSGGKGNGAHDDHGRDDGGGEGGNSGSGGGNGGSDGGGGEGGGEGGDGGGDGGGEGGDGGGDHSGSGGGGDDD